MSLSFWVGGKGFVAGDAGLLKSLFSTIVVRLENGEWGSRYPVLMRDLYAGRVPSSAADAALKEVAAIRAGLSPHEPREVVWDFEQPELQPPWGSAISPHISSLANYFVTSEGMDLLDVLSWALEEARRTGRDLTIG